MSGDWHLKWIRRAFTVVGVVLLIAAFLRLGLLARHWHRKGVEDYAADLMFFGLLGAAALCILVVLGAIPGIKAFGFEVQLANVFAEKANQHGFDLKDLAMRVAKLEARLPAVTGSEPELAAATDRMPDAPALSRPLTNPDDPWKGRFRGRANRDGFEVSANFAEQGTGNLVDIHLQVRSSRGTADGEIAEFFIHPSFGRETVTAPFRQGAAKLRLIAWGGFTVGIWIPSTETELELDLSQIPQAPRVIRDL